MFKAAAVAVFLLASAVPAMASAEDDVIVVTSQRREQDLQDVPRALIYLQPGDIPPSSRVVRW